MTSIKYAIAGVVLAWTAMAGAKANATPHIYALIVGIDHYRYVSPSLQGAVNDATLLASALKSANALDVRVLIDGEATRQAIYENFRALEKEAHPGDWIVFTYAGHGGQEQERIPGTEPDGKDDVMLLSDFDAGPPYNAERIPGEDWHVLLSEVARDVTVLFVADACYSGLMTRDISRRGDLLPERSSHYVVVHDSLAPLSPNLKQLAAADPPNVIAVAASHYNQTTPEIKIKGVPHGALSYYLAQAIANSAGTDSTDIKTLAQFRDWLVQTVQQETSSLQFPEVRFLPGRENEVLPFSSPQHTQPQTVGQFSVFEQGGSAATSLDGLAGVASASVRADADFLWDVPKQEVVDLRLGDPIASNIATTSDLAGVLDKWRALPALRQLVEEQSLPIRIEPRDGGRYQYGQSVSLVVPNRPADSSLSYVSAIDFTGSGSVQWLVSMHVDSNGATLNASRCNEQPNTSGQAAWIRINTCAQPPFGSDHVVIVASSSPLGELKSKFDGFGDQPSTSSAVRSLVAALANTHFAIGMAPLFTWK